MTGATIMKWTVLTLLLCVVTVGLTRCGPSGLSLTDPASLHVVWQDVLVYVYVAPQNFVEVWNENGLEYRDVTVAVSIWDSTAGEYVEQFQGIVSHKPPKKKATIVDFPCNCKVGDKFQVELELPVNDRNVSFFTQFTL
jgi:hypothetical protein